MSACGGEREKEREVVLLCVCTCVCVCLLCQTERECVCVRENERERDSALCSRRQMSLVWRLPLGCYSVSAIDVYVARYYAWCGMIPWVIQVVQRVTCAVD